MRNTFDAPGGSMELEGPDGRVIISDPLWLTPRALVSATAGLVFLVVVAFVLTHNPLVLAALLMALVPLVFLPQVRPCEWVFDEQGLAQVYGDGEKRSAHWQDVRYVRFVSDRIFVECGSSGDRATIVFGTSWARRRALQALVDEITSHVEAHRVDTTVLRYSSDPHKRDLAMRTLLLIALVVVVVLYVSTVWVTPLLNSGLTALTRLVAH